MDFVAAKGPTETEVDGGLCRGRCVRVCSGRESVGAKRCYITKLVKGDRPPRQEDC